MHIGNKEIRQRMPNLNNPFLTQPIMKTIHRIKMQKVGMFLDLAIRRIEGKITREEQRVRCNKIHYAYAKVYNQIVSNLK